MIGKKLKDYAAACALTAMFLLAGYPASGTAIEPTINLFLLSD